MATHSRALAWRIPWTEESAGLQPIASQRVGHDWSDLARTHAYVCEVGGNNIVSIRCAFWFFMLDVQANFWNAIHCLDGLLLLLLSHFSCVRLCATPQTAAHQALPSLGFSRQEHWSALDGSSLKIKNFLIWFRRHFKNLTMSTNDYYDTHAIPQW